ncbi:aldo/keto reductase [Actinoplanes nipponensis]
MYVSAIASARWAWARATAPGPDRDANIALPRSAGAHGVTFFDTAKYSLWWKRPETEIIPMGGELSIGLVPYSPLGKGFLTGTLSTDTVIRRGRWRLGR